MIFVTLGSQKFQFNRLLKAIDELIEKGVIQEDVFAQTGYSDYEPKNFKYKQFLDREEFSAYQDKSDLIITHGGTGAIVGALKKEKKVIAVPRLAKYGEHVDDHQLQIIDIFTETNYIFACKECDELSNVYKLTQVEEKDRFKSNNSVFVDHIRNVIK